MFWPLFIALILGTVVYAIIGAIIGIFGINLASLIPNTAGNVGITIVNFLINTLLFVFFIALALVYYMMATKMKSLGRYATLHILTYLR